MTAFDHVVLAVLGISMLVGVLRGLVKELVVLAGWVAAFVLATLFSSQLARHMPQDLGPVMAQVLAYLAIFVGTLVVAGLVGLVLTLLTRSVGLGWTNRSLGACFGILRGAIVTLALVLVAGFTSLPQEGFWKNAVLSGPFETAVIALRPYLPEEMSRRIRYR